MTVDRRPKLSRSFTKVPNILLRQECPLTVNERLIYIYIMKSPECFAGQATIGRDLGLSRATVQRCLTRMVRHKVIKKEERSGWSVTYIPQAPAHWNFGGEVAVANSKADCSKCASDPVSE